MKFKKRLAPHERKRYQIKIPKDYWDFFPMPKPTKVQVHYGKNKTKAVHLDIYYRLFIGSKIMEELYLKDPESEIIVEKKNENYFLKRG